MAVLIPLLMQLESLPKYDPCLNLTGGPLNVFASLLIAFLVAAVPRYVAAADEKWYDRIEPTGSFRVRFDSARMEGEFEDGKRDRWRFRLRAGANYNFANDWLQVGFQLRSGNPDNPVSDNKTIGEGLSTDDFSLGEVWAHFVATKEFDLRLGRVDPGEFWESDDMQWDSDVTLEGAVQRLEFARAGPLLGHLGASFYQYALEQGESDRAWLLGAQVRPTMQFGANHQLALGAAFNYYLNPQVLVDARLSGEMGGNAITNLLDENNQLVSDFRILTLSAIWDYAASENWPLKVSLFGHKNTGASDRVGTENGYSGAETVASNNDAAYFLRGSLGRFDTFKRLQVRYTYYYSEPDALVFAYAQSDTRRASNLDGHRIDVRVGMPARSFFHLTYYRTYTSLGESPVYQSWFFDY